MLRSRSRLVRRAIRSRRVPGVSATAGSALFAVALVLFFIFPPFSFLYAGVLAVIGILAILTVAGAIVGLGVL